MLKLYGATVKMLNPHHEKAAKHLSKTILQLHNSLHQNLIYRFNMVDWDNWISDSGDGNTLED